MTSATQFLGIGIGPPLSNAGRLPVGLQDKLDQAQSSAPGAKKSNRSNARRRKLPTNSATEFVLLAIHIWLAVGILAFMETSSSAGPDFDRGGGLLPAIAQDADSGAVLMLAWMNAEAFAETLATGRAVYYSRSRAKLWRKGEESGNVQQVEGVYVDCDGDAILLKVRQQGGAACHEGYPSCFFRAVTPQGLEVIAERVFDPAQVYGDTTQ